MRFGVNDDRVAWRVVDGGEGSPARGNLGLFWAQSHGDSHLATAREVGDVGRGTGRLDWSSHLRRTRRWGQSWCLLAELSDLDLLDQLDDREIHPWSRRRPATSPTWTPFMSPRS